METRSGKRIGMNRREREREREQPVWTLHSYFEGIVEQKPCMDVLNTVLAL